MTKRRKKLLFLSLSNTHGTNRVKSNRQVRVTKSGSNATVQRPTTVNSHIPSKQLLPLTFQNWSSVISGH